MSRYRSYVCGASENFFRLNVIGHCAYYLVGIFSLQQSARAAVTNQCWLLLSECRRSNAADQEPGGGVAKAAKPRLTAAVKNDSHPGHSRQHRHRNQGAGGCALHCLHVLYSRITCGKRSSHTRWAWRAEGAHGRRQGGGVQPALYMHRRGAKGAPRTT